MATHRQLPNNTDIAPFQEKGRWYRAFIEKDENGNAKLTYKDAGLPSITPTGYGFTMDGEKDGRHFHVVSISSNPGIGTGNAGDAAFYYPTIGINYTDSGSQYIVDFNHHESKTSIALNGSDIAGTTSVNGINQTETKFDISALTNISINPTLTKVDSADDEGFTAVKNIVNGNANIDLALKLATANADSPVKTITGSLSDTKTLYENYSQVSQNINYLIGATLTVGSSTTYNTVVEHTVSASDYTFENVLLFERERSYIVTADKYMEYLMSVFIVYQNESYIDSVVFSQKYEYDTFSNIMTGTPTPSVNFFRSQSRNESVTIYYI